MPNHLAARVPAAMIGVMGQDHRRRKWRHDSGVVVVCDNPQITEDLRYGDGVMLNHRLSY
jgi:hypothetical protein